MQQIFFKCCTENCVALCRGIRRIYKSRIIFETRFYKIDSLSPQGCPNHRSWASFRKGHRSGSWHCFTTSNGPPLSSVKVSLTWRHLHVTKPHDVTRDLSGHYNTLKLKRHEGHVTPLQWRWFNSGHLTNSSNKGLLSQHRDSDMDVRKLTSI